MDLLRGLWTVQFLSPVRLTECFPQVCNILQETKDINRKQLEQKERKDEQVGQDQPQSSLWIAVFPFSTTISNMKRSQQGFVNNLE